MPYFWDTLLKPSPYQSVQANNSVFFFATLGTMCAFISAFVQNAEDKKTYLFICGVLFFFALLSIFLESM